MTSALRGREGGWSKRDDSTDRLRDWDSDKGGEGVQKSENFADVIFKYRPLGHKVGCMNLLSKKGH